MGPLIRRIFTLLFAATALRHGVFPTSADGAAAAAVVLAKAAPAWTWGAWVELAAAAAVTAETKIVGFTLENFVGVVAQGEVAIASGAGGAEVELGRYNSAGSPFLLPDPLYVPNATRLSARYRNANAVADSVAMKLMTETAF